MNRIDRCFAELRAHNDKALVCFLTAGDPDFATTAALVREISSAGADIIELGVPFSDPMADGPSIQVATMRALQAGATIKGVFDSVKEIRKQVQSTPIALMTYYNPLHKYGMKRFAIDAAEAGVDGVILTDLPPDEAAEWKTVSTEARLANIMLVAPTSTKDRIAIAANMGSGFIYCVSRLGVTGERSSIPAELSDLVGLIKTVTDLPVAVGFGISKPEHVGAVTKFADGAVVGSALVNIIADSIGAEDMIKRASEFVKDLKTGVTR